jgi:mono/diheme cytochrome c family protein
VIPRLSVVVFIACAGVSSVAAQTAPGQPNAPSKLKLDTGKQIYEAGCVACHGPDGKGQSQNLAGFERPETFPDFTDCPTSTPEPDVQWRAIITNGGPARAFSQIMPSFKDLLTPEQIVKVVDHLRSLCTENTWPRGDLNLPRAMITEKAFPENETVVTGAINARGTPGIASAAMYERRIGASAMFEVIVPFDFTNDGSSWGSAFGDLAIGYKQKLFHSLKKGSIFSVGGEVAAPTGNRTLGTGGESTIFEGFAAFGQLLPGSSFLQVHTGFELPAHPDDVPRAYYLRTAIGKTFSTEGGLGRRWSPMIEFIADRDLVSGATTNWDVVPEIQIPMSKRMHILGNIGFRIPANNTADRQKQVMFYVLWDWVDGGLLQGW